MLFWVFEQTVNTKKSSLLEKSSPDEEKRERKNYMGIIGKPRYSDLKFHNYIKLMLTCQSFLLIYLP